MAAMLGERYELRRRLAMGGMAEVWEAHDVRLGRPVAVKVLRTDLPDERARERFEREARLLAGFDHPDAVTLYDVGEEGARPYLVLELVRGRDLARHLASVGRLDLRDALAIMRPVLRALAAAHERGIVHRDVKPANILLGDDGRVRLADFGIARVLADATAGLTLAGQVIGTPRYLAPEQITGGSATPRTDVYAAGVVLYEALAGRPPRPDETVLAAATAPVTAPAPPPLGALRPDLPTDLAGAVDRAVALDPAARPADAAAFHRDLVRSIGSSGAPAGAVGDVASVTAATVTMPMGGPASTAGPAGAARTDPSGTRLATRVMPGAPPPLPPRGTGAGGPSGSPPRAGDLPVDRSTRPRRVPPAALAFVGIALGALGAGAWAILQDGGGDDAPAVTTIAAAEATAPATTPPTAATTAVTTAPPTTAPPTTAPPTTVRPITVAPTTSTTRAPTTTSRPVTTTNAPGATGDPVTVLPDTVDGLVTLLADDPSGYGEDGPALLDRLVDVQRADPRRRNGRELTVAVNAALTDIERWLDDGTIDRAMGEQARDVLRELRR